MRYSIYRLTIAPDGFGNRFCDTGAIDPRTDCKILLHFLGRMAEQMCGNANSTMLSVSPEELRSLDVCPDDDFMWLPKLCGVYVAAGKTNGRWVEFHVLEIDAVQRDKDGNLVQYIISSPIMDELLEEAWWDSPPVNPEARAETVDAVWRTLWSRIISIEYRGSNPWWTE